MLVSVKKINYKAGPHFENIEDGIIEEIFDTNDIHLVTQISYSNYVLLNGKFAIKKETWLEIKKMLTILEFDETKG